MTTIVERMVNEAMQNTWASGASGWVANEALFDATYAPIADAIVDTANLAAGQRVLDIGCGSGTLLAAAAAAGADPVGVDIAPDMVAAAKNRVPSATVLLADAQTADILDGAPGAPFDSVISRFGVMFFDDPAAAFANIAGSCAPGARLTFACWRSFAENPTFTLGTDVLTSRMATTLPAPSPGSPGPVAFAESAYVHSVLAAAGWSDVRVDPLDAEATFTAGEDGIEERLTIIGATTSGRMAEAELRPKLGDDGWSELLDEVRADLRGRLVDNQLRHNLACWLVTARAG